MEDGFIGGILWFFVIFGIYLVGFWGDNNFLSSFGEKLFILGGGGLMLAIIAMGLCCIFDMTKDIIKRIGYHAEKFGSIRHHAEEIGGIKHHAEEN